MYIVIDEFGAVTVYKNLTDDDIGGFVQRSYCVLRVRKSFGDFVVEELAEDGSVANKLEPQ